MIRKQGIHRDKGFFVAGSGTSTRSKQPSSKHS